MKKFLSIISIIVLVSGISSCKGESKQEESKVLEEIACFYSYNSGSSVLEWTAFKFTEKSPVKGTFNEILIEGGEKSDDPKKLIESLKFTITTASVETQNEERNGKIAKLFFETMLTEKIKGEVKSLSDNGKATVEIEMNKIKIDVLGDYTLIDGKFSFSATLNLLKWKAGDALKTLNTTCQDLHTGTDGKSKLWSEVDIAFSTELMSDCD